ncbi:hypothetical protein CIK04_11705 [Vibrio sp. 03_296]|nr:hypothetical protein CIK04_30855 [Vibrio sp. 03_296]OZT84622.1 hypothetical protein CIK04_11705 [Vibrio sp. 03_296]PJO11061.1 helix-turn-helix domain-containing protein [Vibrio vulnificus]
MAKFLKVSRTSVNKWVQTFREEGLEGLQEKPRTGRPAFLNAEQREQLSQLSIKFEVRHFLKMRMNILQWCSIPKSFAWARI